MNDKLSNWLKKEIIPRRKRAAPSPFARWIARVIGILILLVVCWFAVWRVLLYRDVNRQFARIRAAGYPVSGAELNDWRQPVPDTENGALVLTPAFALLRTFPDARSNEVVQLKNPGRTNEWSPATRRPHRGVCLDQCSGSRQGPGGPSCCRTFVIQWTLVAGWKPKCRISRN